MRVFRAYWLRADPMAFRRERCCSGLAGVSWSCMATAHGRLGVRRIGARAHRVRNLAGLVADGGRLLLHPSRSAVGPHNRLELAQPERIVVAQGGRRLVVWNVASYGRKVFDISRKGTVVRLKHQGSRSAIGWPATHCTGHGSEHDARGDEAMRRDASEPHRAHAEGKASVAECWTICVGWFVLAALMSSAAFFDENGLQR